MSTPPFILQPAVPAPGEPPRARIVTEPVYPNANAALNDWGQLRSGVPATVVTLRMVAAPVVDRSSEHRAGLRGFRLVSDGSASIEQVRAQIDAMNAAAAQSAPIPA